MSIPPGFSGSDGNKVCQFKKALYGLKQSPCAWFERFAKVMIANGYKQSQGDYTFHKTFNFKGSHNINCVCG